MSLEARLLKSFIAIVEESTISEAAKRLHIAQPPLSLQLKQLEEKVGVTLFQRHTRKLNITEEGKVLYKRAKEILELMDGTIDEIKEYSQGIQGVLSIGTVASLGAELLPKKIQNFQKKYPKVQFQIWEGDTNRIMELLDKRIIDIGIVRTPIDQKIFNIIDLPQEPLIIVMSKNLDFSHENISIHLSELKDKPLMLLRRQQGTSIYSNELFLTHMIKDVCKEAGFEPKVVCESSDIMTLLTWANHDIGIAIVPKSAMKLIPNTNLISKEIHNPMIMARPSALIWLKGRHLSQATKKFMQYFNDDHE